MNTQNRFETSGFMGKGMSRRRLLGLGIGALATAALASCSTGPRWVEATGAQVTESERNRGGTGKITSVDLRAGATTLDLAGVTAATWAFGSVPAPVIRLSAGDTLRANLRNGLPEETTVHWHGLALRNDMDGVPPITQQAVKPGESFMYEFVTPDPGTYWFHPHVGAQLDRGLYGALIVEDPTESGMYDDEWVIVLDDWLDGVTVTPDEVLSELSRGMGDMGDMFMRMGNTLMGASSDLLGGDAGDVYYPHYLINGKPAADPAAFAGKPGQRIRLRIINAGGDTAFQFAIGGHSLMITHSDGFPVEPVEVDSILLGMGERYDATVTLNDGVFPLIAEAVGKRERAFAVVRTSQGAAPSPDQKITELASSRLGTASLLAATPNVRLEQRTPDREIALKLTGSMEKYDWGINGKQFDMAEPLRDAEPLRSGERVRVKVSNATDMWHPFHLHGHTYQHAQGGPRKDTSIVLPGETLVFDFDANNPGLWAAHCHNIYHAESGMMMAFGYEA